jgi:NAD(P)-dependent dehydrogenase (short-subunit alcohol dehydrogenase family)
MVADVEAKFGGIDILVNNAAIAHPRKSEEITESVRLIIRSRRHHRERHCSGAD